MKKIRLTFNHRENDIFAAIMVNGECLPKYRFMLDMAAETNAMYEKRISDPFSYYEEANKLIGSMESRTVKDLSIGAFCLGYAIATCNENEGIDAVNRIMSYKKGKKTQYLSREYRRMLFHDRYSSTLRSVIVLILLGAYVRGGEILKDMKKRIIAEQ